MRNDTPSLVYPGCDLIKNKAKGKTGRDQQVTFIIVKAVIKECGVFLWVSGLHSQAFLSNNVKAG